MLKTSKKKSNKEGRILIANTAVMGKNIQLHGDIKISTECYVGDNCVIGQPWNDNTIENMVRPFKIQGKQNVTTVLEHDVWLLPNCVVCSGARIKRGSWCDVGTFIGERTLIGRNTWIHNGAKIYNDVTLGEKCNIAGLICNRARLGNDVTSFGNLIHRNDLGFGRIKDRAADNEPSPIVGDCAYIGFNSLIVGGIKIGKGARIGASCIITKDVPPGKRIPAGVKI